MSSLVLDQYAPLLVDKIKQESGDMAFPIWLLVNPRYPAIHHHIWTPILEQIQDRVYRKLHARIDTKKIFIKNVASQIGLVSNTTNSSAEERAKEIVVFRESVSECQPKILITFGTITYEFVRRVFECRHEIGPQYWSTTNLGDEFERSIANFNITQTNRIPLLSRVKKSGQSIEDRNYFSWEDNENYFRETGRKIADRIIENKDSLKIWI
ncbi:conserved hypothetical protein [Candidatus Desulfosporosinus infrequens]|uniref:Uncharacterized protein n=1 Tax=Candidatus Desulfosporosinus infrequens TaxID=2043169 RepID=A0A2U3KBV2_9FIRM|nr:conserved hypothetical protein [Candidatus Desulfosporosinus infrequens]